jgi:hypothetical protein
MRYFMTAIGSALRLLLILTALACASPARAAEPMHFDIATLGDGKCGGQCPRVIAASGQIGEDSADAFIAFVGAQARAGDVKSIVLLDSPGGKVMAAMDFGRVLRRLGMAVIVARPTEQTAAMGALAPARCYSACVYALMGGRKRVIPAGSLVGVHRMFAYSTSFDMSEFAFVREISLDDGEMRDALARYSRSMGVSADLITLAERTSNDRLRLLSRAEIARWRLATRGL